MSDPKGVGRGRNFWQTLRQHPGKVGAIAPSSPGLSRKMAEMVDPLIPGKVVELGAGTGVVTEALLKRGVAPERMVIIEFLPDFVAHLRKRFPQLLVLHGDATHLSGLLEGEANTKLADVSAIVSSLPLRSLPGDMAKSVVSHWRQLPFPHSRVVQFTYDLRSWAHPSLIGFRRVDTKFAWVNLPPARVDWLELEG